jgi:hypothetical protein
MMEENEIRSLSRISHVIESYFSGAKCRVCKLVIDEGEEIVRVENRKSNKFWVHDMCISLKSRFVH